MKNFFKKIHTEQFRWYDHLLLASLFSIILITLGEIIGSLIVHLIVRNKDLSPFMETFLLYFQTIGSWIVVLAYLLLFRHRRPILKAIGTKPSGNRFRHLLLGLLLGFGMNLFCAVVAMLNKDIHISFRSFDPLYVLLLLFAVFVQSSSEELIDRAYLYQVLKKGYRNRWVAILGNAVIFALLHGFNPGVTLLSLTNIFVTGVLLSLLVSYYDSLWCAFGVHTGWNFTQSILLGLPNSGLVVPYSIFELDTASASNSFAYHVAFGIEGTILSTLVLAIACIVIYRLAGRYGKEEIDVWKR